MQELDPIEIRFGKELGSLKFSPLAGRILSDAASVSTQLVSENLLVALLHYGREDYNEASSKTPGFLYESYKNIVNTDLIDKFAFLTGSTIPDNIKPSPNVENLLRLARGIAQKASNTERISARHLLAAILTVGPTSGIPPVRAHLLIEKAGFRREDIAAQFFEFIKGIENDDKEKWREILIRAIVRQDFFAGYHSDNATEARDDKLNIMHDARAFAALIASRHIQPPISIGVFGRWGSGKTFFMERISDQVEAISRRTRESNLSMSQCGFFPNIVQVKFNAWRYMEGDLWASLVYHVFESLGESKAPQAEERSSWLLKASEAAKEIPHAEEELKKANREFEEVEKRLRELEDKDPSDRAALRQEVRNELNEQLEKAGLSDTIKSINDLIEALKDAERVWGKMKSLWVYFKQKTCRSKVLILGLIFIPPIGSYIISDYFFLLRGFAANVSTFLASGAVYAFSFIAMFKKIVEGLNQRKNALTECSSRIAAKRREDMELDAKKRRVEEKRAALEQAESKKVEAQNALERLEPSQLLKDFIQSRVAASDYCKHLGLVSLAYKDFCQLAEYIAKQNDELIRGNTQSGKACINRIVLYIDDLDRCSSSKVVEVLQAIHLILALPLFVVVVGVDTRWMYRSLGEKYRTLLANPHRDKKREDLERVLEATPWDYLGKIFQIPFWIKPMDNAGCAGLIEHLSLDDTPVKKQEIAQKTTESNNKTSRNDEKASDPAIQARTTPLEHTDDVQEPPDPPFNPNPPSLTITQHERICLKLMSPIIGKSPRIAKRFVNLYRLIKAGHPWPDVPNANRFEFVGENGQSKEYRIVILLLAVAAGKTELCTEFFHTLKSTDASDIQNVIGPLAITSSNEARNAMQELYFLIDSIFALRDTSITPAFLLGELPLERLKEWIPRVSRYSFAYDPDRDR